MVQPAQFLGSLQGDQPTLPAPSRRTLRVPPQPWALALASDLRSSLAVHLLDHGRLLAADGPSTSPYAANALLPMSVPLYGGGLRGSVYPVRARHRCCAVAHTGAGHRPGPWEQEAFRYTVVSLWGKRRCGPATWRKRTPSLSTRSRSAR